MHHCKQLLARPELHIQRTSAASPSLSKISTLPSSPISPPMSSFHLLVSQHALNQTHIPTNHPGLSSHCSLLRRAAERHLRQASVWLDATDHSVYSNPEASYPKPSSTAVSVRLFIFLSCCTSQDTAAHAVFCGPWHLPPASQGWSMPSKAGTTRTLL